MRVCVCMSVRVCVCVHVCVYVCVCVCVCVMMLPQELIVDQQFACKVTACDQSLSLHLKSQLAIKVSVYN